MYVGCCDFLEYDRFFERRWRRTHCLKRGHLNQILTPKGRLYIMLVPLRRKPAGSITGCARLDPHILVYRYPFAWVGRHRVQERTPPGQLTWYRLRWKRISLDSISDINIHVGNPFSTRVRRGLCEWRVVWPRGFSFGSRNNQGITSFQNSIPGPLFIVIYVADFPDSERRAKLAEAEYSLVIT